MRSWQAFGTSRCSYSGWYNSSEAMKRKKISNREFFERHREQFERTDRLLRERIAYHNAKLREENPGWVPPQNSDEWQAYYEAKWAADRPESDKPEEQTGTS